MISKLKYIAPLLIVAALFAGYKFGGAKSDGEHVKPKIEGEVYVLPKEFLVNLEGGRYVKLGVALLLEPGFHAGGDDGHGSASGGPEGYGTLPQEAVVRAVVTDVLTGQSAERLTSAEGRESLQRRILKRLRRQTDVKVDEVLFTDLAIQ